MTDDGFALSTADIDAHLATTRTAQLADGRVLGYLDVGDPHGRPVFFFHGGPGSRIEALAFAETARNHGFRVIATDRPGHGTSTYQPGRTMLDGPRDVTALADHLGIGEFGAMGASSGGPSLLAVAHELADRLTFAVDVAGAAPVYRDASMRAQLGATDAFFARTGARMPGWLFAIPFGVLRLMANRVTTGDQFARLFRSSLCPADREALDDEAVAQFVIRDVRESFRQGARGPADDAQLIYGDWGFALESIEFPVHIVHGTEDLLVPFSFSEYVHGSIPNSTLIPVPDQGHYHHMLEPADLFGLLDELA